MDFFAMLLKSFLSLALGGLIGIERQKTKKGFPAGIRTLAFISLLGMMSAFISYEIGSNYFLIASFILIFSLIIVGYGVSFKTQNFFGFTSTIVIFLTFLIGVISYYDEYYYFAVALAIIISVLLTQKTRIHALVENIKDNELFDALKFGIVAFVILPLLPNKEIDPWGLFNPYYLWLLVVLILSINYASYLLSKFLGKKKGVILSGLLGGLISSTATASSLSQISKKNESLSSACAIGMTLSTSVMYLVILIESSIINLEFSNAMIIPLASSFGLGLIISLLFIKFDSSKNSPSSEIISDNPFNFIPALKFSTLIFAILIISKIFLTLLGDYGIYITSFFSSFANTDAAVISVSTLTKESLQWITGYLSIGIIILTNNIVKLFLIKKNGSKEMFFKVFINYSIINAPMIIWIISLLI